MAHQQPRRRAGPSFRSRRAPPASHGLVQQMMGRKQREAMIAVFDAATTRDTTTSSSSTVSATPEVQTVTVFSTATPTEASSSRSTASDASPSAGPSNSSVVSNSTSASSATPTPGQIVIVLQIPTLAAPAPSTSSSSSSSSFPEELNTIAPSGFCPENPVGPCSGFVIVTASPVYSSGLSAYSSLPSSFSNSATDTGFFDSIGQSPAKIAVTVIVSFVAAGLIAGLVAWLMRRYCMAKRRRMAAVPPRPRRPDQPWGYDHQGYPIEKPQDISYTPNPLSPVPEIPSQTQQEPLNTHRRDHSFGVGSDYTAPPQGNMRNVSGGSHQTALTGEYPGSVKEAQHIQLPDLLSSEPLSPKAVVLQPPTSEWNENPSPKSPYRGYPFGVVNAYYGVGEVAPDQVLAPPHGKSLPPRGASLNPQREEPVTLYPVTLARQIVPPMAHLKPQPRSESLPKGPRPMPPSRRSSNATALPYQTSSPSLIGESPSVGVAIGTPSMLQHASCRMTPSSCAATAMNLETSTLQGMESEEYLGLQLSQGAHPAVVPLPSSSLYPLRREMSLSSHVSRWSETQSSEDGNEATEVDASGYANITPATSENGASVRLSHKSLDTPGIVDTLAVLPSPAEQSEPGGFKFPKPYAPMDKDLPTTPRPLQVLRKSVEERRGTEDVVDPELHPNSWESGPFEEVQLGEGVVEVVRPSTSGLSATTSPDVAGSSLAELGSHEAMDIDEASVASTSEDTGNIASRFRHELRRGSLRPQPIELDDDLDVIHFPNTPSNFSYTGTPMPLSKPMSGLASPGAYPFPLVSVPSLSLEVPAASYATAATSFPKRPEGRRRVSSTSHRISAAWVAMEKEKTAHDKLSHRRVRSTGLQF